MDNLLNYVVNKIINPDKIFISNNQQLYSIVHNIFKNNKYKPILDKILDDPEIKESHGKERFIKMGDKLLFMLFEGGCTVDRDILIGLIFVNIDEIIEEIDPTEIILTKRKKIKNTEESTQTFQKQVTKIDMPKSINVIEPVESKQVIMNDLPILNPHEEEIAYIEDIKNIPLAIENIVEYLNTGKTPDKIIDIISKDGMIDLIFTIYDDSRLEKMNTIIMNDQRYITASKYLKNKNVALIIDEILFNSGINTYGNYLKNTPMSAVTIKYLEGKY